MLSRRYFMSTPSAGYIPVAKSPKKKAKTKKGK